MKLAYAALCVLAISACDRNGSSTPEAPVIPAAPTSQPAPVSPGSEETLNGGIPSSETDLGKSQAERRFMQAARDMIRSLDLPVSAHFDTKGDPSQKAKVFVGLRCSSMLRKMKASPKSFTNLYDDSELGGVCGAKDIRLIPGKAVSSFESTGVLFSKDRTSIEISVRADYTVSGYRVYVTNDPFIGHRDSSETIASIDGDRRIKSYRSGSSRKLEMADLSGRLSYSEQETYTSQTRDGLLRKTLVIRGMRENRTLIVREASTTPAPGFLGRRKQKSVACAVQMVNEDGSIHAETRESATCFPERPSLF